ncbi:hypothetical protein Bbelb_133320 [Branchiostoma belcheri]|nr:hypothetical protein Bbelb_133320 [Branchiostoma belcheri]
MHYRVGESSVEGGTIEASTVHSKQRLEKENDDLKRESEHLKKEAEGLKGEMNKAGSLQMRERDLGREESEISTLGKNLRRNRISRWAGPEDGRKGRTKQSNKWNACIQKCKEGTLTLPHLKIKVYQDDGQVESVETGLTAIYLLYTYNSSPGSSSQCVPVTRVCFVPTQIIDSRAARIILEGKPYNRGVRAHKLTMEAMLRLQWQSYFSEHQSNLAIFGNEPEMGEECFRNSENFVCDLYEIGKTPYTADNMRYHVFCQKKQRNEALPPTSDSLRLNLQRSTYQTCLWRRALEPMQKMPPPDGHGWEDSGTVLVPGLMTKA